MQVKIMVPQPEFVIDIEKSFENPVPHRFVHGYLKDDSETRFSILLPERNLWKGRIIQSVEGGMGGNDQIGSSDFGYYVIQRYGAAYITSNHGHVGSNLSKIRYEHFEKVAHKSNYATMLCAKKIVKDFYGVDPDHVYVVGGSGGGQRTTILMEKYPKVYHGGVAVVQANWSIITYYISLLSKYNPVLKLKWGRISETTDVGGHGDPYAVLDTEEEKEGLRELYNAGFPRGAEWQMNRPNFHSAINSLAVFFQELLRLSSESIYYQEYWTKKGYAGHDREVEDQVVEGIEGEVLKVYTFKDPPPSDPAPEVDEEAIQPLTVGPKIDAGSIPTTTSDLLEKPFGFKGTRKFEAGELTGYTVTFKTGKLSGRSFHVPLNVDDMIYLSTESGGFPEGISVGDKYAIDNRNLLSFRNYSRHIITRVEEGYRPPDFLCNGKPKYPQRPGKTREILKMKHSQTGNFKGKMIAVFAAQDIIVWPPVFFNYLDKVKKWKDSDLDDSYRYYFVDNSTHGTPSKREESFRLVSFYPMMGRSIDYLLNWVETDVSPPPSSVVGLSSEQALIMPKTASKRKGLQPTINRITADRQHDSASVSLGKPVEFNGVGEAPVGKIIKYEWYCSNLKDFYSEVRLEKPSSKVDTPYTYTFKESGNYNVVLRITSDLGGDPKVLAGGQRNLAWIKVNVQTESYEEFRYYRKRRCRDFRQG
jgi:hypothetical protein